MIVDVIAPASTANLGPAFDTLGLAVSLYTRVRARKISGQKNVFKLGTPIRRNLVEIAMSEVCRKVGVPLGGYFVKIESDVPVGKGLGSSAAAIVAGVRTMNMLLGMPLGLSEEIEIACKIEGHPDNVLPAFLGGVVSAYQTGDKVHYKKLEWKLDVDILFVIPQMTLPTEMARRILPDSYCLEDVVFNLQRVSLLVSSIATGDISSMKEAMMDRVHQPYRLSLVPEIQKLFCFLREIKDVYGYALSGSGPTTLVIVKKGKAQKIGNLAVEFLQSLHLSSTYLYVSIDEEGVRSHPDTTDSNLL